MNFILQVYLEPFRVWRCWVCAATLLYSVDTRGHPSQQCGGAVHVQAGEQGHNHVRDPSHTPLHQVAVLYHTGHIVYAIAVHTKSSCAPNFLHFPWGVQVRLWLGGPAPWHFALHRCAVSSLGPGSTVSTTWSTGYPGTVQWAWGTSSRLWGGRWSTLSQGSFNNSTVRVGKL